MEILSLFQAGGLVMYALLAASIIVLAIAAERLSVYRRAKTDMDLIKAQLPELLSGERFDEALALCDKAGGVVGELLATTIQHRQYVANPCEFLAGQAQEAAGRLKENLNYVSAIVTLAPLMGLLGTVIGMIGSFNVLTIAEGEPFAVTGGVAEALIATAFGLLVAIMAMIVFVFLQQVANKRIADIEVGASVYSTTVSRS